MTQMTDEEFLIYCDSMADTPRCGFAPSNVARLVRLAGQEEWAKHWEGKPVGVYDMDHDDIRQCVTKALQRLNGIA